MKTVAISSAAILTAITCFIILRQLFGGAHPKDTSNGHSGESQTPEPVEKFSLWEDSLWVDKLEAKNKTNIGWLFTIPRHHYDPSYRQVLLSRKWKASEAFQKLQKGEKGPRDFDGLREKRASSIVTYFCIFVLVLSLIRAALDMNSNLKKVRVTTEPLNNPLLFSRISPSVFGALLAFAPLCIVSPQETNPPSTAQQLLRPPQLP